MYQLMKSFSHHIIELTKKEEEESEGRRSTTHEAVGSVPGMVYSPLEFSTTRKTKSPLLRAAHGKIAKEKRLRKEKEARKEKAMNVLSPGTIERLKAEVPKKPSLLKRIKAHRDAKKWDRAVGYRQNSEYIPDNHGETLGEGWGESPAKHGFVGGRTNPKTGKKWTQKEWEKNVNDANAKASKVDADRYRRQQEKKKSIGETKDHDEYNTLMKKYGDRPTTGVPYSDFRKIEKLGTKLRGKTGTAARPKKPLKTVRTALSDEYKASKEQEKKNDARLARIDQAHRDTRDREKEQARKTAARHSLPRSGPRRKGNEYEIDEARMGDILRNVKKGTQPYTIVAHKTGRVIDQEHTKTAQAVPAFVREMQKKHRNAKISVEDRRGRVLHIEEVQYIDERSKKHKPRHWRGGGRDAGEVSALVKKHGGKITRHDLAAKKRTRDTREFGGSSEPGTSEIQRRRTGRETPAEIEKRQERDRARKRAKRKLRRESVDEANWMVDIDGIGKIVLDGKSSAEIKAKLRKMLRHKDAISSVERMTDPAKKKFFRQKATGKEEEVNENEKEDRKEKAMNVLSPGTAERLKAETALAAERRANKVTPAQNREHQQDVSKALLAQLKKKYKVDEFMSNRKKQKGIKP